MEFKTDLPDITEREKKNYIGFIVDRVGDLSNIESLNVKDAGNNNVTIEWTTKNKIKFDRIRRITGYLVGTVDRWNTAKQAELRDRVQHG